MTLPNPSRATFPGAIDLDLTERLEHEDWLREQRMAALRFFAGQTNTGIEQAIAQCRAAMHDPRPEHERLGMSQQQYADALTNAAPIAAPIPAASRATPASSQPAETGPQAFDRLRVLPAAKSPARARFGVNVVRALWRDLRKSVGVRTDG